MSIKDQWSVSKLTDQMQHKDYLNQLISLNHKNEKEQKWEFSGFTDLEMIYYFVHQKTHIRVERNRTEGTIREYLRNLTQFYQYIINGHSFLMEDVSDYDKNEGFRNLRPRHITHFHNYLSTAPLGKNSNPYTPATIQSKSAVIKAFLRWLYEIGYIHYPLHDKMLNSSISDVEVPNKDFYPEEAFEIINFYRNHPINHGLLTTLMITGLRITEIINAKWNDLTYDAASGDYWLKGVGKRNKPFLKRISSNYFERVIAYRKRRNMNTFLDKKDNSPIFADRNRKPYTAKNLSNYIVNIILKTNLPFLNGREKQITAHSFRHAYAIYLHREGADLYTIQKELGHSDSRTTARYLEQSIQKANSAGYYIKDHSF